MKSDLFKFIGIRRKLIVYFLITILLLGITSLVSYFTARIVQNNTEDIITDYAYLNALNNDVNGLTTNLEKYLTSASSEDLLNYYAYYNNLLNTSVGIERAKSYEQDQMLLKDIGFMIEELLSEAESAVMAKRGRISSQYITHFSRSNVISEYIELYINRLLDNRLESGSEKYDTLNRTMRAISYTNLLLIVAMIIINIYIGIRSTYKLTHPLTELSHSAEEIAKGNFEIELTQTHTGDETDILAGAFIKMVNSVKYHIDDLKEQAEVEKKLKEQEMQNLKISALLQEAELKFLQSQINPHFLFNTLNAASQLAVIEGAERSSNFVQNIAHVFRYNLKNMDELVNLSEEIEFVKNYMNILKMRFGDRISYFEEFDEAALTQKIPRITLQPIVENAYIHGLQNLERKGEIHLKVIDEPKQIKIIIFDNGSGMTQEQVEKIIGFDEKTGQEKHLTGIGVYNVVQRLKLLFHITETSDLIQIESEIDMGTKVTLALPKSI